MNAMVSEDFDAPRVTRGLVRAARRAALATLDADSGAPYVSLVAVATMPDGAPILRSMFYRHWPRHFYVTNASADLMRQ